MAVDSVVLSSGSWERVQSDADARTEILRHLPAALLSTTKVYQAESQRVRDEPSEHTLRVS